MLRIIFAVVFNKVAVSIVSINRSELYVRWFSRAAVSDNLWVQ